MGCMGEWAGELRAGSGTSVEAAGTVGSDLRWKGEQSNPVLFELLKLSHGESASQQRVVPAGSEGMCNRQL